MAGGLEGVKGKCRLLPRKRQKGGRPCWGAPKLGQSSDKLGASRWLGGVYLEAALEGSDGLGGDACDVCDVAGEVDRGEAELLVLVVRTLCDAFDQFCGFAEFAEAVKESISFCDGHVLYSGASESERARRSHTPPDFLRRLSRWSLGGAEQQPAFGLLGLKVFGHGCPKKADLYQPP